MSVRISDNVEDIIKINRRSVKAKEGIRIIELSSLGDVIPKHIAEEIRRELLANKVPVRQLTNHKTFGPWTEIEDFIKTCMEIRYISKTQLPIATEVLLFNDIVAMYRIEPTVSVIVLQDQVIATQQQKLFDLAWANGKILAIDGDGST
jgi:hypothetical protein